MEDRDRLRAAVRLIEMSNYSIYKASIEGEVDYKTLRKAYEKFKLSGLSLHQFIFEKDVGGRPRILNDTLTKVLRMFVHTLDASGFPVLKRTIIDAIGKLRKEEGLPEISISSQTYSRIKKQLRIPQRRVRNDVRARDTKSSIVYIEDFYEKLKGLMDSFNFRPDQM